MLAGSEKTYGRELLKTKIFVSSSRRMIFEAIATRISVRGEAPAVYTEYMRIAESYPT
jgi:hypothetical protein